ncbi:MAG: HDOD domain-containing protein [Gammaproteobacteria bacterium]|nr:HDOD domain-containing protein [Gammaproteobacteria bacterium]
MAATSIPNIKNRLTIGLRRDLENDCLELPSLPDVAVAVTKALGDKASDASDIADIIQTDPAITAKLVKAANSAMYGHCRPVTTCTAAVIRLGSALTHKLVMSLSVRELFTSSSPILLNRMRELWRHSTEIAAICYVLARYDTRFSPDQALLVGLLHDIGVVAILQYIEKLPVDVAQSSIVDEAIRELRAETSGAILQKWRFPPEYVVAAYESEDWMRDKGIMPDYCDLVIAAQLHSFAGTDKAGMAPNIDKTPAYFHLALGELTSLSRLKILEEEREKIHQAELLLNV